MLSPYIHRICLLGLDSEEEGMLIEIAGIASPEMAHVQNWLSS